MVAHCIEKADGKKWCKGRCLLALTLLSKGSLEASLFLSLFVFLGILLLPTPPNVTIINLITTPHTLLLG